MCRILRAPHFGYQAVLEAKIEIPDVSVVDSAHASPALEARPLRCSQCLRQSVEYARNKAGLKKGPT